MMRRFFLRLLYLAVPGTQKRAHLDELIAEYNRHFEQNVLNIDKDMVCYERETWHEIRVAFAKIIHAVKG